MTHKCDLFTNHTLFALNNTFSPAIEKGTLKQSNQSGSINYLYQLTEILYLSD